MSKYEWTDDGYFVTDQRDVGHIRWVLTVTMALNFLATAIKVGVGLLTGSLSVLADGLDSLFDGISNVVGLAGLYIAGKPPDAEHPYGHRKFETVAALVISFLLFLTCWQLIEAAWNRIGEESTPQVNLWVVAAMLASVVIQAGTSIYELRAGRRLGSEVLVADAMHTRASILVSISVLVGLFFVRMGFPIADPLLAIFVALVIAKIGIDILRENLPVLVDRAPVDPRSIADVVSNVAGVESFHRVRSRGAPSSAAVDLHVRLSPDKTVQEADAIGSEIRRRLLNLEGVNDVTVHLEAQRERQADAVDIFAVIRHAAEELQLTIHEARAQRLDGNLVLDLHVGVDPDLTLGEAHGMVDRLESRVRRRVPDVDSVHTHIEMASKSIESGRLAPQELERLVVREVGRIVEEMPALANPHNIIVRQVREDQEAYLVSLECTVAPDTPVVQAHRLSSVLEQELGQRLEQVVDVSVHLEPPEP